MFLVDAIDYNDYVEYGMNLGREYTLSGYNLTPPDPYYEKSRQPLSRHIVVGLRGTLECENLWRKDMNGFDYCWIVLKMVKVRADTTYYLAHGEQLQPGLPHDDVEGYVPQFVAAHSIGNRLPMNLLKYIIEYDNQATTYAGIPKLVGICDINAVGKYPVKAPVVQQHLEIRSVAEIAQNTKMSMDFFI